MLRGLILFLLLKFCYLVNIKMMDVMEEILEQHIVGFIKTILRIRHVLPIKDSVMIMV